ncbi:hypothetical protein MMC07_002052 [Pseudocyphellaria aurata]|nr:hypothetical protein [Pseudocyphellaria aurata]
MAGQIIIRDSDDEDEDDTAANPALSATAISSIEIGKTEVESSALKQLQHSGEHSTGSTELLSREIEDACKSLLEPTPDGVRFTAKPRSSSRQLSGSPRLKKRRATTNLAERKEKKAMITYSRASQDDSAHFRSSGSGAGNTPRRRVHLITDFEDGQKIDASSQAQENQAQSVAMEASVHADFPRCSSNVSFPTASDSYRTGQILVRPEEDSAESKKLPSLKMNQPEPVLNDSSLPPKEFSRQEDDCLANSFLDELSIPTMLAPRKTNSKQSKLTRTHHDNMEPSSDEVIDGLPAEQYKPRPSRSRTGNVDLDLLVPADFSKRPETTGKRKKSRRKTTAFERPVHGSEEDREIVRTRDPVVIIETRNNVETTSKDVKSFSSPKVRKNHFPGMQNAEPMTKSVSSKKKDRPDREVPESTEDLNAPHAAAESLCGLPEPEVSDKSSLSKPVRKKQKVSPEPLPHNISDSKFHDEDIVSTSPRDHNFVFKETRDNQDLRLPRPSPSIKCTSGLLEFPSPTKAAIPPQTPQKTLKGPDKHSPLASSKVAYRVGLSKRARIEPLLRIVRK